MDSLSWYLPATAVLIRYIFLNQFDEIGHDKGGYYHELFLRGKPHLANKIPRTKLKNDGARKSTSPETEPNFYSYPFLPDVASSTAGPMVSAESDRKIATSSVPSSTQVSLPDSRTSDALASYGCTSGGNILDSTYTLARMAQSANVLQLNNSLEQLRNLDLYSSLLPALTSSSTSSTGIASSNVDLLTRLLYRDTLNNLKDNNTLQLSQARNPVASQTLTPLQQLLGQHQAPAASFPVMPNSVLSSSPSILEAARIALMQHQLQQQDRQRSATNSNILSTILSSNNNNSSNDVLALRLAIANGYSSVDQFLRDVAMGRSASLANDSNHSTSTGSNSNINADSRSSKRGNN